MEGVRCKLYVGGLSTEISEAALKEYFSKYCEVTDALIITGKEFGFVTLVDESMIDQILREEHVILGRKVEVDRARPRNNNVANVGSLPYRERRIFVGGLPSGVTKEECRECFEKFGRVLEVVLIYGKNDRKPRGFGFITFDSDEAIQRVTALRFVPLKEKTVEVKRAEPRMGYKKKTNTFETSGLHLALPSTYNPSSYSNYSLPTNYNPFHYSNYFPYYSVFNNPFPPFCALPNSTFPVQNCYYQYVYKFGGSSVTLNGDSFGSPSSIVSSNTGPVNAVPSSPSDSESTVQDKFVDPAEDLPIGSSTQANMEQNGDDPAKSSEVAAESEEKKVDDGLSLSCNGGNPYAHCNGNSTS